MRWVWDASEDTYDSLPEWMPLLAVLVLVLHPLFWLGNQIWDESESSIARLLAVIFIAPLTIPSRSLPERLARLLKRYTLSGFILTGPAFLLSGLLLELSAAEPSLEIVLRRQYEFAGSFITVALIATDILAVLALGLLFCGITLVAMILVYQPDFSIFQLSWITMTSGYLLIISVILIIARSANLRARAKRETLGSVGSMIAHELRTPLLTIQTLGEVINSQESSNQKTKQTSEAIIKEAKSAATLIDIFLVNSTSPDYSGSLEVFSVRDAIEEAVDRYPYRSASEKQSVITSLEESLSLFGPRTLFVHIIFNLLKNSFNNKINGRDLRIQIEAFREERHQVLEFTDNGSGIEADDLKRVFDSFFTRSNTGSGVGLAFVRSSVERHFNGTITCISSPGEYTKFTIRIPVGTQPKSA